MISSLLIANRGEIACRIIRTARRMGIRTIAVYSDADARALHVREADEAVHIGGAAARDSYLSIDRIVAACTQSGAGAVHPGYGFLSENADFARACGDAGIVFVGPPPDAIAAMGDKIAAKKIAAKAGVAVVPGHPDAVADAEAAVRVAKEIGFPVMLKASAGGGGKGMRVACDEGELREGFSGATAEAAASFGDGRVFVEKFVEHPRHIEIQVLADGHGNVIHLGERECSIQRRNQKVIEEAPSPFLDAGTRAAMGAQAVALAKAVGYRSAGTVEFIVDAARNFYFLEMNTRLQVEHPVTEMVTGLDLVELMLRIAAGDVLPFGQEEVRFSGWALEARVYAEDPYRGFLPSTGRLTRYRVPEGDGVRVDSGVHEGAEITPHYDPMIAKLVTHGADRAAAIEAMADALDRFEIEGVGHNLPLLSAVMDQARFREGRLTTGYIAEEFPDGFGGVMPDGGTLADIARFAAVADAMLAQQARADGRAVPNGARVVTIGAASWRLEVAAADEGFAITGDLGEATVAADWRAGAPLAMVRAGGRALVLKVSRRTDGFRVRHRGADLVVRVLRPEVAALLERMPSKPAPDLSRYLLCPMPGQVVRVEVGEGEVVEAGQTLAVVEAMKMENVLRAERRARVARLRVAAGDVLAVDAVIMEFEGV